MGTDNTPQVEPRQLTWQITPEMYDQLLEQLAAWVREWAEANRPEWVWRLRKTKKLRTRKKYLNRIIKAYREEHKL